jgi:hypothetical protein
MFDVFYFGPKPNLFEFEQPAGSIAEAASKCRTGFFWYIYGLNDYAGFNWDFQPAPWQDEFLHVWPNQWQTDGQVYLAHVDHYQGQRHYHDFPVHRLPDMSLWHIPSYVDSSTIDTRWCPDPADPAYIYHVSSQHQSASGAYYTVSGATQHKLTDAFQVTTVTNKQNWSVPDNIDTDTVDFTWHPNPLDPAYIYHFPSQHQSASGVTFTVPGATEVKVIDAFTVQSLPSADNWTVPDYINPESVDFTWHPNPLDPAYIYHFPSQHQSASGVIYAMPGGQDIKLVDFFQVKSLPTSENWSVPEHVDRNTVDFSWHPNPLDPAYIYNFPSQHQSISGVTYTVVSATDHKIIDAFMVMWLPDQSNWLVPDHIIFDSVDFSWRPNPLDPAYIYHFPSQHQSASGVIYTVPGATDIKISDGIQVQSKVSDLHWTVPEYIDELTVDFSWHPNPLDPAYIYHFSSQHQLASGVMYTVPGGEQVKISRAFQVTAVPYDANWTVPGNIDSESVDFSWHPNPLDPAYIYHFPSQHQAASGVIYTVSDATEIKLVDAIKSVYALQNPDDPCWCTTIPVTEFDYSWHPNPLEPAYIYVFGNQWNPGTLEPTVTYTVPGATEQKFIDTSVAKVAPDWSRWRILDDVAEFDYSWRPNPTAPAYKYIFGNQWLPPEVRPALEYVIPDATEIKYMNEPRARRTPKPGKFQTLHSCTFDYSWEPDPGSPPYIYVFGNQWYPAQKMPTVQYVVKGATKIKYMDEPRAVLSPTTGDQWNSLTDLPHDFDRSWCPDPGDPPLIYQFGNQHWPANIMPTVEYRVPGATVIKYMDTEVVKAVLLPDMDRWEVPENIDVSNIDFSWCPNPKDPSYTYHFATAYQISSGLIYKTPGAAELKFLEQAPAIEQSRPVVDVFDIFFVDRLNAKAQTRFERLRIKYPKIQKIRYANSMLETIRRCAGRSKTSKFWVISSEYNYDDFDFHWHAEPWQNYMTHVFASQWQKWSDTFLINKWEFERHSQWAQSLEQFPNLNFVSGQSVHKSENLYDIYYVDHNNPESRHQYEYLRLNHHDIVNTRFVDSYLDTFKRIINTTESEYVWIINSVCDYTQFDFSWQPEPWQAEMIHVFPSGNQKRGDTFLIHAKSFKEQMIDLEMLDWFNVINYCDEQKLDRFEIPVVKYDSDNLIQEIQQHKFEYPYTLFTNHTHVALMDAPCLWTRKDRSVKRYTRSGATALVPRDVKADLRTQIYDYPYIDTENARHRDPKPLDIVFISNGEPDEFQLYNHTHEMAGRNVKWSRGVNGRVAAYQAAAEMSDTPWFFAVFAKLRVDAEFDWEWQPDYFQEPKHYIFNARNLLNGLEYGHQGLIAYNRNLVLANNNPGIDFTLSQPHESVPVLSGVAEFNADPWMTWRTAFREVLKLRMFMDNNPTVETENRLNTWLKIANGVNSDWCLWGASDAVAYYDEVSGDPVKLQLSFDWTWLRGRFNQRSL